MAAIMDGYPIRPNERSRTFSFNSPDTKCIEVTISTFSNYDGKTRFFAAGRIDYINGTITRGQCLADIKKLVNDSVFDDIYYLWETYTNTSSKTIPLKDSWIVKRLMTVNHT